jgi:lipoprotein-anchoring transpeptidase ErfK/SrfK
MSTPNPTDPGRRTQREREEEKRRRETPQQPGEPRRPEGDRPRELDETEEDWSRTPR